MKKFRFNPFNLALKKDKTVCSVCSYTEGYNGCHLEHDNTCDVCHMLGKNKNILMDFDFLQKQFLEKVEQLKKNSTPYHCIVGVSGGKDSLYVLNSLVKNYGLHPLAVSYDNDFMTQKAKDNREAALRILGVDLFNVSVDINCVNLLRRVSILNNDEFCKPCVNLVHSCILKAGSIFDIPIGFTGFSRAQLFTRTQDIKTFLELIQNFQNPTDKFIENTARILTGKQSFMTLLSSAKEKKLVEQTLYSPKRFFRKTCMIVPYYIFHNVSSNEIINCVKRELEWMPPDVFEKLNHSDCAMERAAEWIFPKTRRAPNGEHKKYRELASEVRLGNYTLEEAAKIVNKWNKIEKPEKDIKLLLKQLDLEEDEVSWR